jgi:hypothetical protein
VKSLVDDFLKQQEKEKNSTILAARTQECSVCHATDKPLTFHCLECEEAVCKECEIDHKGMSTPEITVNKGLSSPDIKQKNKNTLDLMSKGGSGEKMLGDALELVRRRERCHSWHQIFENEEQFLIVQENLAQMQSKLTSIWEGGTLDKVDVNLVEALEYKYKICSIDCVALQGKFKRLHLTKSKLWFITDQVIQIFTKDCLTLQLFQLKNLKGHIMGAVPVDDDTFAVACWENKGLLLFNSNGKLKYTICNGSFSDVAFYEGKVYALCKKPCSVVICEQVKGKWRQIDSFPLCVYSLEYDTICVSNDEVYICSWFNDCLTHYDTEGQLKNHYNHPGVQPTGRRGSLIPGIQCEPGFEPRLCCVDAQGNCLVAACMKGKMQVCSYNGNWKDIGFDGDLGKPRDAVTDDMSFLWIVTYFPKDVKNMYSCSYPYLMKCMRQSAV